MVHLSRRYRLDALGRALPPEVRDKNLVVAIAGLPLGGVGELYVLNVEAAEELPNFRNVIQGQDKLAAQTSKPLFELSLIKTSYARRINRLNKLRGWAHPVRFLG